MSKSKSKKSKTKTPKKTASPSGMIVKNVIPVNYSKSSSVIPNKNFSSAKKGGITGTPRKS